MWLKVPQAVKSRLTDNELGQITASIYMTVASLDALCNMADVIGLGSEVTYNIDDMRKYLDELEQELDSEYDRRQKNRIKDQPRYAGFTSIRKTIKRSEENGK